MSLRYNERHPPECNNSVMEGPQMNDIQTTAHGPMAWSIEGSRFLMIPSEIDGFHLSDTPLEKTKSRRDLFCFQGFLEEDITPTCPIGNSMRSLSRHRLLVSPGSVIITSGVFSPMVSIPTGRGPSEPAMLRTRSKPWTNSACWTSIP